MFKQTKVDSQRSKIFEMRVRNLSVISPAVLMVFLLSIISSREAVHGLMKRAPDELSLWFLSLPQVADQT
jgi:hypothetical protein